MTDEPVVAPLAREQLRVFLDEEWGRCGCGSPELADAALFRLLKLMPLYEHREEFGRWVPDEGVAYTLLYQLDRCELTEHGGSIGGSWLTEKGEAVLLALAREEVDGFVALNGQYCCHGFDIDDQEHDCMAVAREEDAARAYSVPARELETTIRLLREPGEGADYRPPDVRADWAAQALEAILGGPPS